MINEHQKEIVKWEKLLIIVQAVTCGQLTCHLCVTHIWEQKKAWENWITSLGPMYRGISFSCFFVRDIKREKGSESGWNLMKLSSKSAFWLDFMEKCT